MHPQMCQSGVVRAEGGGDKSGFRVQGIEYVGFRQEAWGLLIFSFFKVCGVWCMHPRMC